jgi:hypothetical protein
LVRKPISFVSAAKSTNAESDGEGADDSHPREVVPKETAEARRERRLSAVPDVLRDALRKLEPDVAEPALAFFSLDGGGNPLGMHHIVLETEEPVANAEVERLPAQIVLKLDFDAQTWKRVRKKGKHI